MKKHDKNIPIKMLKTFEEIMDRISPICKKHLNKDYQIVSQKLLETLCRKRPSPLSSGKVNSWAAAIVYTIGATNFLFDKSFSPYLSGNDLCERFGISQSTVSAKSKIIRDLLKITQLDPKWTLPSQLENNPVVWLILVNGMIMDARDAPLEIQKEAFEKKLIPYIPTKKTP